MVFSSVMQGFMMLRIHTGISASVIFFRPVPPGLATHTYE